MLNYNPATPAEFRVAYIEVQSIHWNEVLRNTNSNVSTGTERRSNLFPNFLSVASRLLKYPYAAPAIIITMQGLLLCIPD
jgi:hypothetical protein